MGRAVYVISVAAELAGVHPQTLRVYERRGLSTRCAPGGGSRRYSERDLERLRRIQDLTSEDLNLEGVRKVLVLEAEVERLQVELQRVTVEARETVEQTHRQYRRDLVPLRQLPAPSNRTTGNRAAGNRRRNGWPSIRTGGRCRTQQAVNAAGVSRRASLSHAEVTPEHLLAAILAQPEGIAVPLLARAGVDTRALLARIESSMAVAAEGVWRRTIPPCSRQQWTFSSRPTALRSDMGDEYLSVEHLLLSMSDLLGVGRDKLLAAMREVRGSHR